MDIVFFVSTLFHFIFAPSHFMVLLIGGGLVLQARTAFRRLGWRLSMAGLAGVLVLGLSPLSTLLILPLEERFPAPERLPEQGTVAGIIMLGGFEDGDVSIGRKRLALSDRAERLVEGVRLARRLPGTKLVFSGGAGGILYSFQDAGGPVGAFLEEMGIDRARIVLETKSRTTWENAVLTKQILKPSARDRYLLVTSAWHMPRAMGVFRKAGFNVVAWPVDFMTSGAGDATRAFAFVTHGLVTADVAAKEWLGLLAYWMTGRSSTLWPGP